MFRKRRARKFELSADLLSDLSRLLTPSPINLIFDVGANIGQSTVKFRSTFPWSRIHAFEPASEAFLELKQRVAGDENTVTHNVALGEAPGEGQMIFDSAATNNHLSSDDQGKGNEVRVLTGDMLMAQLQTPSVDFLKIDAEGHDLRVLEGFRLALEAGRVGIIQVETGFLFPSGFHVPLKSFMDYLYPLGYRIFGIYDQALDFEANQSVLRRANVLFIKERLAANFSVK